jgi:hypothetical protein
MFHQAKNHFIISLILILSLTIVGFLIFDKNDVSATNLTCADSDGGKDYYSQGYVSVDDGYNKEWDLCAYNSDNDEYFLYENYCEDNQLKTKAYPCPDGCTKGACVKKEKFVTITSPNGGERLNNGETYDITWNSQGVDNIYISLVAKDDSIQTIDIAYDVPASSGKYSWKVNTSYEGEYKIYIKDSTCLGGYWPSESLYDYSDEYFTIIRDTNDIIDIDFEVVQVEGFEVVPDIIPYNALFTVRWNAPGASYCDAGGDALPLSEEDTGMIDDYVIENWPDLTVLPNSGTKTLYARVKTSGYVTPLTIKIFCGNAVKELTVDTISYEVPLNQPACGTISVSSNKVKTGEQFTVTVKGSDSEGLDRLLVGRPNAGWISRSADGATNSEADFVFSESEPGIYYYDGDVIGTRPNGSRDQIRTNPKSVKVEVIEAGQEVVDCAKEYGEEYWCGSYEDWQNECQGEGNTISLEQGNKVCKGTDWPLSYCVTCKSAPPEFYYPHDGAILHTLNPQFITENVKAGKYYQLGIWQGEQILPEEQLLTWINAIQEEWEVNTSQEGPVGQFKWNQTYTTAIRECNSDSFSNCDGWTDSIIFSIEPGEIVYESDQGKDYYNQGYISVDAEVMIDECLCTIRKSAKDSNVLIEYYSTEDTDSPVAQIQYECPYGCADGRCLKEEEKSTISTCVDSDGGKDYYTKGKLSYENNPNRITEEQDTCLNENYLLERFCGDSKDVSQNREKYFCVYGCEDGACIKEPSACLPDGTLIKLPNDPKIYVIQNCQKKWIRTQEEFKQRGYKWEDVQEKPSDVVNAYSNYLETQAELLKAIGQNKVYRIVNGKKLFIPTIAAFNAQGLKWEDVEDKSTVEINQYPRAKLLKSKNKEDIYYITESGLRRQIPNDEVFNSYGNKWEDVLEVEQDIIESYEVCNLIKPENSYQVYKLEGDIKRWIKTADVFNRLSYSWSKVAPVNEVEFNNYQEGEAID